MTVKQNPPFAGKIERLFEDATPQRLKLSQPAQGKPNVVIVMLDDVGFGSVETFGGPIPAPGVDRIAAEGLKFNQFHTTALCSPTRAALLTGRNQLTCGSIGFGTTINKDNSLYSGPPGNPT